MAESEDTETLLAILSSLLQPPIPEHDVLLDALIHANGKVDIAAKSLHLKRTTTAGASRTSKKRAHTGVLDDWLTCLEMGKNRVRKKGKHTGTFIPPTKGSNSTQVTLTKDTRMTSQNATPGSSKFHGSSKALVSLTEVLRPPPPNSPIIPRLIPFTLTNPSMVEKYTPCTLHLGILPPELACRLFHRMVFASKEWSTNKWWLFDRVVESPHKTSFYSRQTDGVTDDQSWQQAAQFWYNGRVTSPPAVFPSEMEEACQLVEKVVNKTLKNRSRYPLEWGGTEAGGQTWKANVAASNCYAGGKEGVGFHSDQLTYLGPFPTIASLSLGTTRIFRLREVIPRSEVGSRQARTFNIPVIHNSLVIMHASTQERFKHSIPPQRAIDVFRPSYPSHLNPGMLESNCRINITFRFYRPDFRPPSIPRCRCDVPCVLRADMKGRDKDESKEEEMRYFWMCYAGAQNDGKGCSFLKVMDVVSEGRGPLVRDCKSSDSSHSIT